MHKLFHILIFFIAVFFFLKNAVHQQDTGLNVEFFLIENSLSQWIGSGYKAPFPNIQHGEYVIRVKGCNNDMIWNKKDTSFKIIDESSFWNSKLAYIVYGLIFILAVIFFIRYRTRYLREINRRLIEKQSASIVISEQKEELFIKNKNIIDSLNYAKRIQRAMMPSEKLFKTLLPNSFVLHKPKDIVSGDFYWVNENNRKIFVSAVDCTGHGVPGAFMSIIGFELFRNITHIEGVEEPAQILNRLNKNFAEIFKDVDDVALRDGMDLAFCVIDKNNSILEFSGAFNPLYLIRDNKIIEIKGNRFSVGLDEYGTSDQDFTNHAIPLKKDDMIYIFTDGYADQFGGPEGKKYKYRRFRHLLLNIHKLQMEKQKAILEESIEKWRGNLEQVDDILVIGISSNFY